MTQQQVITLIQTWIIENHNEEITADVLRPIMEAMVNQPNDLIGDLDQLNTADTTNLVNAINSINVGGNNGIVIFYGSGLPQIAVLPLLKLGDFYAQISGSNVLSFWQWNGQDWVQIKPLKIKTVLRFVSLLGIDTDKPQVEWARDAINQAIANNGPFTCEVGEIMTFFFNFNIVRQDEAVRVSRKYFRLCTGENVVSNIFSAYEELMPDGSDDIDVSDFVIDLGDIGTDEVWYALNNSVNQPFDLTDENFIQAIQNGELKLWQWRGGSGTFGNGATLAQPEDFLDLSAQPNIIGINPTLQEVIDASADGGGVSASFPSGNLIEDDGDILALIGDIGMVSVNGENYIAANDTGLFVVAENNLGDNGDFLVNVDGYGRVGWRKLLDDAVTSLDNLWSAKKISDELATKQPKDQATHTGTVIPLDNPMGSINNTATWNNPTYTLGTLVTGGNAINIIDTTGQIAFPDITGATLLSGSAFEADKIYEMHTYTYDGTNAFYFFLIRE